MAYTLSQLPINGNQETTQESNYIMEIMLERNDTDELSEGIHPANLNNKSIPMERPKPNG